MPQTRLKTSDWSPLTIVLTTLLAILLVFVSALFVMSLHVIKAEGVAISFHKSQVYSLQNRLEQAEGTPRYFSFDGAPCHTFTSPYDQTRLWMYQTPPSCSN